MSAFSKILAIDSSTSTLRVGLHVSRGKVVTLESRDRYRHAEFIFQLIDGVVQKSHHNKDQLDGIVVSTGPGSFTGLRVGLAAAKGLAVSLGIPLTGVSTYSSIAGRLFRQFGPTGVLIPSRRDEFYFGLVDSDSFDDGNIRVISAIEIESQPKNINLLGIDLKIEELNVKGFHVIRPEYFTMEISDYITAGRARLKRSGGDDISRLEPLYIQRFPAKIKR
jgi:tRNA threonylcarbamoyl adenosine modification protein YeaZ